MDINSIYTQLVAAGNDWADKKAAYNILEDTRNSVLAKLTMKSEANSVAAREIEAKASKEYEEHVKATQEALKDYLKAEVKYKSMQVWVDLQRSKEATERALIR